MNTQTHTIVKNGRKNEYRLKNIATGKEGARWLTLEQASAALASTVARAAAPVPASDKYNKKENHTDREQLRVVAAADRAGKHVVAQDPVTKSWYVRLGGVHKKDGMTYTEAFAFKRSADAQLTK